jgi:hypothetical protein
VLVDHAAIGGGDADGEGRAISALVADPDDELARGAVVLHVVVSLLDLP